ncbi:MAG: diaminopimelate epimerase, partial [Bacteroidales bacterium]|nr:diaminopimelate epimerase [Bacteroidales bacterium]
MKLYKMSGAGNDFVVLDGRDTDVSGFRQPERIAELCREYRTDGLMILDNGGADFRMEFYNPDGSGGMMCGNGGRCIVAFADWLGITPSAPDHYSFLAPDGLHSAEILFRSPNGWTVKLKMIDVEGVSEVLGGYFLNTGTRHFVKFVEDVDAIDVAGEGKTLRWNEVFAPEGANINFVQRLPDGSLKIRTFEKGVEGETLACGTGITAAAIAVWYSCSDGEKAGPCPE